MGGMSQEQQAIAPGMNNYADAYRQNFVNDASSAADVMLGSTDARAAASGMAGGSRHGNMQAQGFSDINSNLQSNLANVGYQDYTNNINRQQQAGMNADNLTANSQRLMSGLLGQQNQSQQQALAGSGAMQGLGNSMYNTAMMPTDAYSKLMQSMGAPVVLSESDSSSSSRQGGF